MLFISILLGFLYELVYLISISLLNIINELLSFLNDLFAVDFLQRFLHFLLLVLLLIIDIGILQLLTHFLSQIAENTVGEVLQVVTVRLEQMRVQGGASIWLRSSVSRCLIFESVVRANRDLAHFCLFS